jgi:hypothetical protein
MTDYSHMKLTGGTWHELASVEIANPTAAAIADQMSGDDREAFTQAGWRDGVSTMLEDGDDLDDVLDAIVAYIACYCWVESACNAAAVADAASR